MRRAGWLATVCAVALSALVADGSSALPRLEALRGEAPRIQDARGRQVLLRGVNVNQLGDYYSANPRYPTVIPLRERDFAQIARLGFNSVRLIVSWSKLEPRPGAFNRRYVRRIREAVAWARERRLYVILDMHQDAWGKHIATEPGESCLPGFSPAVGWDGAPAWATLTDDLPTCKLAQREISPAVGQAWQSFYLNREGIQSALARTWGRLARRFAADPTVAGYDLLNEPNPGLLPGVSDGVPLGQYYERALARIRAAEKRHPRGFSHIVFFEPGVLWSAFAVDLTPPPNFTNDPNLVFAPHLYAESITLLPAPTIEAGFDLAAAVARTYGVTVWSGEWGWFGDPTADAAKITRYAAAEDAHRFGGAWWSWRQSCGDPHVISEPGGEPGDVSPSLVRYGCPENEPLGIPPTTRRILSRATVRHAPGRITSLASNPATGAFRVAGSDRDRAGGCVLRAWVPGSMRPRFESEGVRRLRVRRAPGGWLVLGCARGGYELQRVLAR